MELVADWVRRRPRRLPPQAAEKTRRPSGRLRFAVSYLRPYLRWNFSIWPALSTKCWRPV